MAIYQIVKIGDQSLRDKAKKVSRFTPNLLRLLDSMGETMYDAKGVGLAAPQIGVPKRLIVLDAGEGLLQLVNPEIVEAAGEEEAVEGCLSIPGLQGEVTRAERVLVRALDGQGQELEIRGEGMLARVLQHEIDHLDGILFIDRASRVFPERPEGEE